MATYKTFSNIYLAAEYADLEVRCGNHVFYAHRAAVCARSRVLDIECKTGFSTGSKVVVDHSTFEAQILDCVLQFVYQNEYAPPAAADDIKGRIESLATHVHVHAFADMYDMAALKSLAAQNFVVTADQVTNLSTAQIIELIASIYTQTTGNEDILRARVLKMAFVDKKILAQDPDFVRALTTRTDLYEFAASFIGGISAEYEKASAEQQTSHNGLVDKVKSALEKAEKARDSYRKVAKSATEEASILKDEAQKSQAERERLADEVSRMQLEAQLHADTEAWRAARIVASEEQVSAAQKELAAAKALAEKRRVQLSRAFSPEQATRRHTFWQTFDRCRHCSESPFEYFERVEDNRWVAQCNSCRTRHYYTGV